MLSANTWGRFHHKLESTQSKKAIQKKDAQNDFLTINFCKILSFSIVVG